MATIYDQYITAGLDKAKGLVNNSTSSSYTPYTSSAANAPTKTAMYDYQASSPLQQIAAPDYKLTAGATPTYQGLMGGDYNKLQTALTQPGQIEARNAYNQGTVNLTNTMGGNGLYGSSIMQNQQRDALDSVYQDTLAKNAANAAAQRYQMEQAGLQNKNQFGLDLYGQQLAQQKDQNAYSAQMTSALMGQASEAARTGLMAADQQNQYNTLKFNNNKDYNDQLNAWKNQQNYEKNFLYPQAQQAWNNDQDTMLMNRYLALAGQGAPLANAANSTALGYYQTQGQMNAADTASNNQLWAAGAGLLGNIYGNNSDAINSGVSSAYDGLMSYFG